MKVISETRRVYQIQYLHLYI